MNIRNWALGIMTILLMSVSVYALQPGQAQVNLQIKGMKCGGCETKIKSILKEVKGVVSTESVSAAEGTAVVIIDKKLTSDKTVATTLADKSGYDVKVNSNPQAKTVKGNAKAACCSGAAKSSCGTK